MRYKAKLLRKEGTGYIKIKDMKFKPEDTELKINDSKTIPIKLNYSHRDGNTMWIYIDMDKETQIAFNEWSSGIDGEDIDVIVTKKFLTSLLAKIKQGTEITDKSHVLIYILVLLAGISIGTLIGVILGQYMFPPQTVQATLPNNPVV